MESDADWCAESLLCSAQALEALGRYSDAVAAYEHGLTVMPDSDQLLQGLKSAKQKEEEEIAERQSSSVAASDTGASSVVKESGGDVPEYRLEEADEHLVVYVELPDRDNIKGVDLQLFPGEMLESTLGREGEREDSNGCQASLFRVHSCDTFVCMCERGLSGENSVAWTTTSSW